MMTGISATQSGGAEAPLWAPAAAMGGVAAAAMAGPSLFPKDPKLQRVGIAAAFVLGAGSGLGVEATARGLSDRIPGDHLAAQLAVGGTGTAMAAGIVVATRGRVTGGKAALMSGGMLLAAGGAAGAASTLVSRADGKLAGPDWLAQGGAVALAGGAMLGIAMRNAKLAQGGTHLLPDLPELAADATTFGRLAIDRGRGTPGALVSGRAGSPIDKALLPGQGHRFTTEMPHAADIERVMGAPAKEPIRTYVGLAHAPAGLDEEAAMLHRVELAMQDLEFQGAFGRWEPDADGVLQMVEPPRKSILIAAPTSSGFINPVSASSHEFMALGDTATVTIQVGDDKAAGEMHNVARATATHQELLRRVNERLDEIPIPFARPSTKIYGESFGAWTSQNGLLGTGDGNLSWLARKLGHWNGEVSWTDGRKFTPEAARERFRELGIDRAMYVGTPKFAMLRPGLAGVEELTGGDRPPVRTIRNLLEAKALSAEDTANTRVTFLQHDADPVGVFHPSLLWEPAEFLGPRASRGDNISPHQRWLPIVTGIQTALDQAGAQFFRQGVLEAKGHDYRSEVSYVMRRAYGFDDVTDTQVSRIREWNRQQEEIHALHQQQAAAAGEHAA